MVVPLLGITVAVALPLLRYAERERDERAAIAALQRVQEAQRTLHARSGAYATSLTSLTEACGGLPAPLEQRALDDVEAATYSIELRATRAAATVRLDCHGHALADDYFVSVSPLHADAPGRQAMAARADGRIYLFHDGIPPRERDMERGLATPVEERERFRIP